MIRVPKLNGAVLSALLFLFVSAWSYGQSAPADDIFQWEQDIALFDSLNLAEQSDINTLLVTGSSSVRLWDSIRADLAPYQVMQRGYGGAKLTDFNYYAERIIKSQRFKAIVVFVANDIAGVEGDRDPKEVKQLFKELVGQLRQRNPGTPVFWVEITPTPKRWQVSPQIRQANLLIERYCKRNQGLHFIHTFDHYITAEGLPDSTFFQADMLHLNRKGYLQWSEIIKASLADAGIGP